MCVCVCVCGSVYMCSNYEASSMIFEQLRGAGLKVWQKKCTFWETSCVYLGYVVGSGEVKPM